MRNHKLQNQDDDAQPVVWLAAAVILAALGLHAFSPVQLAKSHLEAQALPNKYDTPRR